MFISANIKKYKKIEKRFLQYETENMTPNIKIKWKFGHGYKITDIEKKKYIDFTSGIFTSNIGYNNKEFKRNILSALKLGFNHSYTYYNDQREKYISKLIKFIDSKKLKKCFLVSAGTEATEAAIKAARTFCSDQFNEKKKGIICLNGNWHGRTMGSAMLSGKNSGSDWIGFFDKNIYHLDFPYPWIHETSKKNFFKKTLLKKFKSNFPFKKKIAMIMLESFQGWGALFYPKNYIKEIAAFCKKNNILLCFDEMQAGFGRTGKRFGFQYYNVDPDMICIGKGMGSGFPLAALVGSKKIFDNKKISGMSSTHSANPVCCAAGLSTIDIINKKKLIENSRIKGSILHKKLKLISKNSRLIFGTYGKGLIGSLIFKDFRNNSAKRIADLVSFKCLDKGLLVCNTGRESIKLGPPLIIDKKGIEESLKILNKSIYEVENQISK